MQVIDKAKERAQVKAAEIAKREKSRRAKELLLAEASKPKEFKIDSKTWLEFLAAIHDGCIMHFYGNKIGGAFFLPEQIIAAERFFALAVRDRKQIIELVIDEYDSRHQNIPLGLPIDPEIINDLTSEATILGVDYETYLRALFYSQLTKIRDEYARIKEEQAKEAWDNRVIKTTGCIYKDLRKKLVEKYGEPETNDIFGQPTESYFNLLVRVAEEYFELTTENSKQS